jgi:hypothetical protein
VNNHPGVKEMLARLDALKNVIRDFTAREEKLNGEFRVQSSAALNAFAARNQAQESAAAALETNAAAALEAEKHRCNLRFERRKVWINRAHAAVSKRVMNEIGAQDSQWKERTQQGVQAAGQQRELELAEARATFENFQKKLGEAGDDLTRLETAARGAFRGYGKFQRLLAPDRPWPEPDFSPDENALFAELQRVLAKINGDLDRFKAILLPKVFRFLPVWIVSLLLLAIAAAGFVLPRFGWNFISQIEAVVAFIALVAVVAVYWFGGRTAAPAATAIAGDIAKGRRLYDGCHEKSGVHHQQEQARIENDFETTKRALNQEWKDAARNISQLRGSQPVALGEKAARIVQKNDRWWHAEVKRIQQRHLENVARLKIEDRERVRQIAEAHAAKLAQIEAEENLRREALAAEWKKAVEPLCDQFRAINDDAEKLFPAWDAAQWKNWKPPQEFLNAAKFARLEVDVATFAEPVPKDARLAWPGPATLSVPLTLVCPAEGSILFETGKAGGDEAFGAINNLIFRLLSATPPGKLNFTIFDPVGLGQNFAALTHLTDYDESSISSRIWTQTAQFDEKLAELNEHMEKIIQMYLRNEYATIAEYNAQAGSVAEKYHFLVIASFPVNFSDTTAKRLRNIAANGARCGVYTLIQWDQRTALPQEFVPDELRKNSVCLVRNESGFELSGWRAPGVKLIFDAPPPPEFATNFLQQIGESSKNSNRVEVPFEQIAPTELWQDETTELLRVPIGRSGATKLQYLEIGSGTRQHALIAGKTGSGKSTLFHVIITNLALRCSPEQVEFYLVDFKKGVEFKCYGSRRLPHARVVAIESDREFGLSVLQRVDDELRRRGDLFRKIGAQDLAGYKRAGGTEPVPRSLLMIDEFQEFFTEEDRISQGAAVLLDRIVRQGRAFGIHVILGSQTLGGAYTLARATIGQMVIRIALQCNEADAYLIMDQDNPAPRLLSRPGEGIYNDDAGAIEGNSPFQAVWLSDKTRDDYLAKIRARADQDAEKYPGPIVFEGNAPADVLENIPLRLALQKAAAQIPAQAGVWLGAPNSIKGPTEAVFRRQSGNNLLIVAQSEERTLTMVSIALVSLAAQFPKTGARFVVLDSTPPGFPQREFLQKVIQTVPQEIVQGSNSNLAEVMGGLAEELKRRTENELSGPDIFVLVQGLQNFKKLRQEDEFSFSGGEAAGAPNPAATLMSLITEGPARGIHVIVTCDTYNNVNRFLGRKALAEFEMRVVFQMSAGDSASLIDAPDAATLGLHRALYFNDREGYLETFRPYAQPDNAWIETIARRPAAKFDRSS